ncbi:PQQ-binding-like beta-propeller repeat protein [Candidatus Leptofilum sp.]|uniref:outer membrane protein assembly factor BamB family protein n=1 Tax=Candidatus Leptofilum sp. TaxID=3241576 RepID=UPI003B5ACF34
MKKQVEFFSQLALFVILCLSVIIGLAMLIREPNRPKRPESGWTSREFENESEFEQLWMQSNVYTEFYNDQNEGHIFLATNQESVFMVGSVEINQKPSLIKFNLHSGEVDWVAFDNRWFWGPNLSTMASDTDLVFVGDIGGKNNGTAAFGASKITAYDAETGDSIWTTRIVGAQSIDTIAVIGSSLNIHGSPSRNYHLLDAATGEVINTFAIIEGFTLFSSDEVEVKRIFGAELQAIDKHTNTVIWEQKLSDIIIQPLVLVDGVFFARTGADLGQLVAIDQVTGNILWKQENVASNIAVENGTAYFLTEGAQLLVADAKTGEILRKLVFSPAPLQDVSNHGFYVAVSDDILVVYFGDSQNLFAFRDLKQ